MARAPESLPSMDSISKLPNELLLNIFDHLASASNERYQHLATRAHVSRRFNHVVTPLLYSEMHGCCFQQVNLISRTISANPHFADKVRRFADNRPKLDKCGWFKDRQTWWNTEAPSRAMSLGMSLNELKGTQNQKVKALESLFIMSKCQNLQEIALYDEWNLFLLSLMRSVVKRTVPSNADWFGKLHTLSLTIHIDRPHPLSSISIAFKIPSLRSLTIKNASTNPVEELAFEDNKDDWECSPRESGINDLVFEECLLDYRWISRCITSCRTLRHFQYEFLHDFYRELGGLALYPGIFKSLLDHRDSLEFISINELHGCHAYPANPLSWRDFTSLTHLDIPLYTLCPENGSREIEHMLPRTLQVLTVEVRSAREGFSDWFFLALARAKTEYLVALRTIEAICRIDHSNGNQGFLPLRVCHLERYFTSLDMEFTYVLEFIMCKFFGFVQAPLLRKIKKRVPDGPHIAKHSSLEIGCLRNCTGRYFPSEDPTIQVYMGPWVGPGEFEPGYDDGRG